MNLLLTVTLFAKLLIYHPFHVSVCDIAYNSDDKHYKISIRLFLDDLEGALRLETDDENFDIMNRTDSLYFHQNIGSYVKKNLAFIVDGEEVNYDYVGSEYDIDVLWCYFEIIPLENFTTVEVSNTILLELFDDQENLVTIRKNGKSQSSRLNEDKTRAVLNWD